MQGDKKRSAIVLLENIDNEAFRQVILFYCIEHFSDCPDGLLCCFCKGFGSKAGSSPYFSRICSCGMVVGAAVGLSSIATAHSVPDLSHDFFID